MHQKKKKEAWLRLLNLIEFIPHHLIIDIYIFLNPLKELMNGDGKK